MRMLDPQTWQFDMSYCLLLPVHSPGIPISITSKYCYYYPPPLFLPLPKSQNIFSMHEYKHKLNQLCNKIWRDFYCTSHVYRMYKGTFEIRLDLTETHHQKRIYQSNKSEKRGKEGTKTQTSDWATDSGADIFNREVFNFKETELITKNATNWLAQKTTICIHVSNLLILVSRQAKEKGDRKIQFLHFIHAMRFIFVQGMQ